jgi:chromosome segregation ATPase
MNHILNEQIKRIVNLIDKIQSNKLQIINESQYDFGDPRRVGPRGNPKMKISSNSFGLKSGEKKPRKKKSSEDDNLLSTEEIVIKAAQRLKSIETQLDLYNKILKKNEEKIRFNPDQKLKVDGSIKNAMNKIESFTKEKENLTQMIEKMGGVPKGESSLKLELNDVKKKLSKIFSEIEKTKNELSYIRKYASEWGSSIYDEKNMEKKLKELIEERKKLNEKIEFLESEIAKFKKKPERSDDFFMF